MRDRDFETSLQRFREDREHGASEIARAALRLMADCARKHDQDTTPRMVEVFRARAAALAGTRPSMAPLYNHMTKWSASLENLPNDPVMAGQLAAEAAEELARQSRLAAKLAAARLASRVPPGAAIMTHSLSSTIVELYRILKDRDVTAIVSESRPLCEGYVLAAKLDELGIRTTLVTDAQMGLAISGADVVAVGADSILADGRVVNKVGTYLLALAAREAKKPFYVCAESYKRCPAGMPDPPMERMDPAELGAPVLPGVTVVNAYFEITPAALVTACVAETDGIA